MVINEVRVPGTCGRSTTQSCTSSSAARRPCRTSRTSDRQASVLGFGFGVLALSRRPHLTSHIRSAPPSPAATVCAAAGLACLPGPSTQSPSMLSVVLGWEAILVDVAVPFHGGSYWDGKPYWLCPSSCLVRVIFVSMSLMSPTALLGGLPAHRALRLV